MLSVEALAVRHAGNRLLGPVSFTVGPASVLTIMGETGAGKSLIAQSVMGTLPASLTAAGSISVDGRPVDQLKPAQRRKLWGRTVAMLPQEPWQALDPLMRSQGQVYESYRLVAEDNHSQAIGKTRRDFQQLNLVDAAMKLPGQLSGGMSQRVAFAAAVAGGAPLLLADEPTKGLDFDRRSVVIELLKQVAHDGGTLVVITHDVAVARALGGRLLVLREGAVVEEGDTSVVLEKPAHAYTREILQADPQNWKNLSSRASGQPLLTASHLSVGRHRKALTQPVSFSLTRGSRLAIIGPSGIGKTTLLDTIAGLAAPISGKLSKHVDFSKTDIQKIYQDPPAAFAPKISLRRALTDVAKRHDVAWSTVEDLLLRVGIADSLLDRRPAAVSGGELQRVAIVRAMLPRPLLLLADEPTSRLDPITQQQTMDVLAQVTAACHTAVVLVTHDRHIAASWADNSLSLDSV